MSAGLLVVEEMSDLITLWCNFKGEIWRSFEELNPGVLSLYPQVYDSHIKYSEP